MPQPPRRSSRLNQQNRVKPAASPRQPADQGWDPVAAWYDKLVGETGSDYHRNVILPAALRLLNCAAGESVIDLCCGQGVLAKPVLDAKIGRFVGVDASPRLIQAATARHGNDPRVSFITADVCQPATWADGSHNAAACLMAVHDVPDAPALFSNMARSLKLGGRAVMVMMHPCFRIPKHTHWGWDTDQKIQYRRTDRYGTALEIGITTHPGKGGGEETHFHHRSLSALLNAIASSGLSLAVCEELYSHRRSQAQGPFSKAEHRAAEEIPLFLALKAIKNP